MSHAAPSAKGDGEGCAFIVGLCIRHCLRRGLCRFASDVWFARWYGCSSRNLTVRVVAGTSPQICVARFPPHPRVGHPIARRSLCDGGDERL